VQEGYAATTIRQLAEHADVAWQTVYAVFAWLLTGPWTYRSLVRDRGWSLDQYEVWIADTLHTLVLRP
jgi:hypothetical protein